jgi:general stress protein YciG
MAKTKAQTQWHITMLAKFNGDEKALQAHMQKIGGQGGKNSSGYQFAHGTVDPSVAGKVGGARSKRRSKHEPSN